MSPCVAPGKDSKRPEWEVGCVTYSLNGNILNQLDDSDLWKMTVEKKAHFMSFYVRALDSKNRKLAARQVAEEVKFAKDCQSVACGS
jgi:hypothetical protein